MIVKKHLETVYQKVVEDIERLAEKIALILEREVVDVLNDHDKLAKGNLVKSIRHKVYKLTNSYLIKVFSGEPYSVYVHEGTRPHFPPVNKIASWVRTKKLTGHYSVKTKRRLGGRLTQRQEDLKLAWAIAYKISRYGTRGLKFFDIALKQAESEINKEISKFKIKA